MMSDCNHKNITPLYEFVKCNDCGSIKTDSHRSWGVAKNTWFESLEHAEFYKKNGFLPKALTDKVNEL